MFERLKRSWQRFKASTPGRRFQDQFNRRRQSSRSHIQNVLFVGGGILLIGVGLFFLLVPGPGLLIVLFGAILIAQQSLLAARALDWAEVRLRKLHIWSLRAWRRSSPALKILLLVLALIVAGAMGLGAIKFLI
jgi:hypothetical protein